eukprot:TRINITY_DN1847_c0_g1_i1.p1 TRINITY_DN1847_c0_g1~~TRINITY_DN1847_c0_g1_i1.p1  ORF type:complete len:385 (+),score=65.57 TRINITY_DN1847_c0_g1_i1:93-1247(+)
MSCFAINGNTAPSTIGSYGDPAKPLPIIHGGVKISNWQKYSGNIFVSKLKDLTNTTLPTDGIIVTGDGLIRIPGRFPKKGWLRAQSQISNTGFTDGNLTQASGYWNGATIRMRSSDWTFETRQIQSFSGGKLTWNPPTSYTIPPQWGYYLDSKIELLTEMFDWFYDTSSGQLYMFFTDDPSTHEVFFALEVYGINSVTNSTIENLAFSHYTVAAVYNFREPNATIQYCQFQFMGDSAISIGSAPTSINILVKGNQISNCLGRGIIMSYVTSAVVRDNVVRDVGMIPGLGASGENGATGILVQGPARNFLIQNNTVLRTGYHGIRFDGAGHVIQNNWVTFAMMTLNDGGPYYTYQSTNNKVFNNYAGFCPGSIDGTYNQVLTAIN